MSDGSSRPAPADLWWVAAATAVVIAIVTLAGLVYLLLDILLLVFLGIVVAAALQPWHVRLCGWGVPKGPAVLLIYLLFLGGLVGIAVAVGPPLLEEMSRFAAALPENYASVRTSLATGPMPFRLISQQLPPFERLVQATAKVAPQFYGSVVGLTASALGVFAYVVTVLAIAFYWTMEVPRLERLALSFLPVARRAHALNVWHEIESKLGAFIRGQGLAMLTIGVASGVGYALIGLPHVLALAVLAGLLEGVPLLGPVLVAVPAVMVAMPLGVHAVLPVIGLSVVLQGVENNLLMPRIMERAVGVSALVSLVAVLAFGTLYGILGVFIAVPMAAIIQVALESLVSPPMLIESAGIARDPWTGLKARVRGLREEARSRLRARDTRMGIDPGTVDHVGDIVDQRIEKAIERVETVIERAQVASAPLGEDAQSFVVEELEGATGHVAQAVDRVEQLVTSAQTTTSGNEEREQALPDPADLNKATEELESTVERVEVLVAETSGPEASGQRSADTLVGRHDGQEFPSPGKRALQ